MLVGIVETVIVDNVHRGNGFVNLDVHAKYDASRQWQIKKVATGLKIGKNWELRLQSATKFEYIKMDETMPEYIHVIDAIQRNANGNINKQYTLYRRYNGHFTRRTLTETRRTNRENARICYAMLYAMANQK